MNQTAVVNYSSAPHSVRLEEIPVPTIGDHDVLLEVAAIGVCGSDLHQWTGEHSWPVNYPVVLGHEFSGRIHTLGREVTGWKEGDRVCSETAAVINPDSPMSRSGRYNLDPNRKGFGYGVNGAMTHYVRVPSRCLHRVPDGLPLRWAALTEPLRCVLCRCGPGQCCQVIASWSLDQGPLVCYAVPSPDCEEPRWPLLGCLATPNVLRSLASSDASTNGRCEEWAVAMDSASKELSMRQAFPQPSRPPSI
ncbi:MAG: alcohol dehydrogenase catalytic domain-containing protein [Pirellulales bacterium]